MTPTIEVLDPLTDEAQRHHRIWRSVHVVKKLSDRVVGIGPFGVGMDGLLTWIPGAGIIYSVGAGAFLVTQAVRAQAKPATIGRMVVYLLADAATSEVPLIGDAVDMLFPAHMMAANALQKDIEDRHGAPPEIVPSERARKARKPWFRRKA